MVPSASIMHWGIGTSPKPSQYDASHTSEWRPVRDAHDAPHPPFVSRWPFLAFLFVLSLWPRLHQLHSQVYGDESLYYYLSYTLGLAPASVAHLEKLWTHLAVRPFLYLFFFPWAHMGFTAFRCANIVVGSSIPCLMFLLCKKLRVNSFLAIAAAAVVSFHPTCVVFSTQVFPDTLATALVLLGYLGHFTRRVWVWTLLFCLMVLTKEAFAMFLLPLLVVDGLAFLRHGSRKVLAPVLALVAVAITNSISTLRPRGALSGLE